MQFYCVKTKKRVEIEDSKCTKTKSALPGGRVSYLVRAVDGEGNKMTKFVSKDVWESLKCKEGK